MTHLLGSIGALVSGAVIALTGWVSIDPVLSLFICGLILFSTLRLLRESLHTLMEGVPFHLSLEQIGSAIAATTGVRSMHDLHVWTLSSSRTALSAHVVVDDLAQWERVLQEVGRILKQRFQIEHTTLQPEPSLRVLQRIPLSDRESP